jgi:HSP20 family protein
MIYQSMFPRDIFNELDRLQREVQQAFEAGPSIRGVGRGGFPALNVGTTPASVELYAFMPGLDPDSIEVNLERGVLTIGAERRDSLPGSKDAATVHMNERFTGRFRRVVSLPDDVDPNGVEAEYRDGVLHVCVKRQEAARPRRISVQ